ncbi:CoA-transferase subunit beta [Candidatus Lokiarchaeum ossiferum]|uniref:CoA-transferase subunit beta n=1 Tax=Candidatus Lokiarchaeum ossiferum TaxID=2951803 RepID=UPI00352C8B05
MSEDNYYTATHLMAVTAAKLLLDERSIFVGTGLPMIAAMFAQRTHAPNLLMIFEAGSIGTQLKSLPISVGDSRTGHRAISISTMHDNMSFCQNGWVDYGFLGGAEIDKYGNLNTTFIGNTWDKPKVRLPGSGGGNDVASLSQNFFIVMRQSKRNFVDKVSFITSPGYLDGPGARERAGLPANGGPVKVITQLAVYGFDEKTKIMKVEQIHPGVTIEDIKNNLSFEVIIPDEIQTTTPPTKEEVALLRELDPQGMAVGK